MEHTLCGGRQVKVSEEAIRNKAKIVCEMIKISGGVPNDYKEALKKFLLKNKATLEFFEVMAEECPEGLSHFNHPQSTWDKPLLRIIAPEEGKRK